MSDTNEVKLQKRSEGRKTVRIILEQNDDIPPTGLFLGLNGVGYLLRAGEEVEVPQGVVDILNNAIASFPITDPQTHETLGYRERMRYSYRLVQT